MGPRRCKARIPVIGHVSPMFSIAQTLVENGHDVCWYTGELFQKKIEATGACFIPMTLGLDYSIADNVPEQLAIQRSQLRGLAQLKFDLEYFFIKAAVGYAQDLLSLLQQFSVDGIGSDSFFLAAAWVHELKDIPWAQLGVSALTFPSQDVAPYGLGLMPNSSFWGRMRNRSLYSLLKNVVFRSLYPCIN